MAEGCQTLTEREKQALRLMGRGHDAKSMARHLGLSVHTVNERLRAARRKLSVSSSREAARRLLDSEPEPPKSFGDKLLGEAGLPSAAAQDATAIGRKRAQRPFWVIAGVVIMAFILGIAALMLQPQSVPASADAPAPATRTQVVRAARDWLGMVDAGLWAASWRATGAAFRSLNTVDAWTRASEQVRVPLGAVISRSDLSQETVPTPPYGAELVKFRTSFANRANVVETLTLVREGRAWRVVGYLLDRD